MGSDAEGVTGPGPQFSDLITQARAGNADLLGRMLAPYGSYLKLLAQLNLDREIRRKVADSDIVQETFMQAQKNFAGFRGTTEAELMAWLRAILAAQIAQHVRYFHRNRRDVARERRIAEYLERSSASLARQLPDPQTSPSMRAARHERQVLLADALAQLKPEHREVIVLKNLEELSIDEVARRIGRSPQATKSLWVRALANLRHHLKDLDRESG